MYSDLLETNIHEPTWSGIGNESTLHLIVGLREGMYHETSGRDGYGPSPSERPKPVDADMRHVELLENDLMAATRRCGELEKYAELYEEMLAGGNTGS